MPSRAPSILYVASVDRLAGAETQLLYLARAMKGRGCEVGCAFIFGERGNLAPFEDAGVECDLYDGPLARRGARLGWLVRVMRRRRRDIVQTLMFTPGVYGRLAAWWSGVPVVVASEHSWGGWKKRHYLLADRLLAGITDLIVTNSEANHRFVTERVGIPRAKVILIRNGFESRRFEDDRLSLHRAGVAAELGLRPGERVVGTVGNLTPWKNHGLLLDAAALLRARGVACRFLVAGGGPLAGAMRRYADARGLGSAVSFLGPVPVVERVLSVMDVFVLSSSVEGMPTALLEAFASGLPCVVTDVGGNPEFVRNGETGFVVPPDDAEAMASRIEYLLCHRDEAAAMGRRGQADVRRYTIEAMADAYWAAYCRLRGEVS